MTRTLEQLEATAQLDRALSALGEGLAASQDVVVDQGGDLERIAAALAKCVQNIFNLKSIGLVDPASPTHIRAAMDHLRKTLSLLQDSPVQKSPVMTEVTQTVARCLALLYPVFRLIDQIKAIPRQADGSISPDFDFIPRKTSVPPPEIYDDEERRSVIREIMDVEVGIHSGTNFFTGFSQDISSGGIFICTYDILPIGTRVNVNFSLPYGPVFSVDGTVRWLREFNELTPDVAPGMGVQFYSLSKDDEDLINDFLSELPPMFFE